MYYLQSAIDNGEFKVNKNITNSSSLLKNICDITLINAPIKVPCTSQCLERYIKLAQKEVKFLSKMSDQELAEICKEMCILDSDVVLNSIAKQILRRIQKLKWDKMMEYFGLEDDFSIGERKFIGDWRRVEYLISMDTEEMKFPLLQTNFSAMKNKFFTPFNALLARVIKLSEGYTAFELSKINKSMKNESDRYPIKLNSLSISNICWRLEACNVFIINNPKFFNQIKKRKVTVLYSVNLCMEYSPISDVYQSCASLNFVIPTNLTPKISFHGDEKAVDGFNVKECPFSALQYDFTSISINFDKVYQHLIAKDFTKELRIFSSHAFDFFYGECLYIYKKPNEFKFHDIKISSGKIATSKFLDFLKKYVCNDGFIYSDTIIFDIPHLINSSKKIYPNERLIYSVSNVKRNFKKTECYEK